MHCTATHDFLLDDLLAIAYCDPTDSPWRCHDESEITRERSRVEQLGDEVQHLAFSKLTPETFCERFIERTASMYRAPAVSVWAWRVARKRPEVCAAGAQDLSRLSRSLNDEPISEHVREAFSTGRAAVKCIAAVESDERCWTILQPIRPRQRTVALLVVELGSQRQVDDDTVNGYLRMARHLGECFLGYLRNRQGHDDNRLPTFSEVTNALRGTKDWMVSRRAAISHMIEEDLARLAGLRFETLGENRDLAMMVHELLDANGLRAQCPECGAAAILRCLNTGNSRTGVFSFDHTIEGRRKYHCGATSFPKLKICNRPRRRARAAPVCPRRGDLPGPCTGAWDKEHMSNPATTTTDTRAVDEARRQIQDLVRHLRELSKRDLEPSQYFAEFLRLVVRGLGGVGGAVWVGEEGREISLLCRMNLQNSLVDLESEEGARHFRLVDHVFSSQEAQLSQPNSTTGDDGVAGNPTESLLVLAPVVIKSETYAVIEVFQRPTADANTQRGYLRFLRQTSGLASEWAQSRHLNQLDRRVSLMNRYDGFIKNVYCGLDPRRTAFAIANEVGGLIECDRVSVGILYGKNCRIEAVSGQDVIDKRSNVVGLLGKLATRVVATAEPLWYSGSTADLPPQIEKALEMYVGHSHAKSIAVLPIFRSASRSEDTDEGDSDPADDLTADPMPEDVIGAIIVERIEELLPRDQIQAQLSMIQDHAGRALSNALQHRNIPLMPLMRAMGVAGGLFRGRTRRKTFTVMGICLLVLICISLIPIDFEMEGRGTLQPVDRHDLFAPLEGQVVHLHVSTGDKVHEGQLLIELENHDLELALEQNRGRIASTEKKIETLSYVALQHREMTKDQRLKVFTELNTLDTELANFQRQASILKRKQEGLRITSPIDGRVATWNVEELLSDRPVAPHQVLLTVFDPDSGWELELNMPEKRMGHINDALAKLGPGEKLSVEYVLASDPHATRVGTLDQVRPQTTLHEEEGHSVLLLVGINAAGEDNPVEPHLGVLATGRVKCGRRSMAYVHLHEAWEWVQLNVIFKFF